MSCSSGSELSKMKFSVTTSGHTLQEKFVTELSEVSKSIQVKGTDSQRDKLLC